ncbi:hypothetical protein EV714DRAFT_281225 [Schizophyllum commune]
MASPIIFYSIPSQKGCWSLHTLKIRYALNYKGLPFRTEWVEYPDIEKKCKEIGAEPTDTKEDGSPLYTLPVISDPSTGKVISDGPKIAKYLDDTYPDTPKLYPPGTEATQKDAMAQLFGKAAPALRPMVVPCVVHILGEGSKPYFRATREKALGCTLEEKIPKGEDRKVRLEQGREAFEAFLGRFEDEGGKETPFLLGESPCFADFSVAGFLQWIRLTLGDESDVWKAIEGWSDGRVLKYLEDLRKYEGDSRA